MSKHEQRRSFVKGLGLFGALLGGISAGATGANAAILGTGNVPDRDVGTPAPVRHTDIAHLAPENPTTLTLMGGIKKEPQPVTPDGLYCFTPINPTYQNQVHLSVGKDDRLWIKVGDTWRRVALEG